MTDRVPKKLTAAFLAAETAIYAAFLVLDLTGRGGLTDKEALYGCGCGVFVCEYQR